MSDLLHDGGLGGGGLESSNTGMKIMGSLAESSVLGNELDSTVSGLDLTSVLLLFSSSIVVRLSKSFSTSDVSSSSWNTWTGVIYCGENLMLA